VEGKFSAVICKTLRHINQPLRNMKTLPEWYSSLQFLEKLLKCIFRKEAAVARAKRHVHVLHTPRVHCNKRIAVPQGTGYGRPTMQKKSFYNANNFRR
jgi:hypothetical protein